MNRRLLLMLILCLLLTVAYGTIGLFYSSFYNVEIILLPFVFVFAALLTFIIILIKKSFRKQGYLIFLGLSSLCFVLLIGSHIIDNYKPSLKIYIPENYEGIVHLFPVENENAKIFVDDNGIGYIPRKGNYNLKVFQGTENITDVLNEGGSGNLTLDGPDSLHYTSISSMCFIVEKNAIYPTTFWNQKHARCMNSIKYDSLVNVGIIDGDKIFKQVWQKPR